MPGRNQTGPMGMGPMTGRGLGYCSGAAIDAAAPPYAGRGFGAGYGRGRSFQGRGQFGRRFGPRSADTFGRPRYGMGTMMQGTEMDAQSEHRYLQDQASILENQLNQIKKRMEALAGDK